jgi:hypothetical protein
MYDNLNVVQYLPNLILISWYMFTIYNIVVNNDIRCKQNSRGRVPGMGLESRSHSCRLNIVQ